ncbi:16S rRNA processing protein RimM [Ruminococcaceae bacterium KH2T8]|nr:16S rRNA processing protein RimM [Ruminococcaceae bacterium KH2T8]
MINDRIIIGKVIGAHGVRGEVKVFPITDNVRRFTKLKKCYLVTDNGTVKQEMSVKSSRVDRENALVTFEGCDDRDKALLLKGLLVAVDRDDAVKLPKGEFFIVDLIGLSVIDEKLGELGKIDDVYETGAGHHILSVKRKGKKDLQIPFLKTICIETDIEQGIMKVILPDGLYEIYE